MTSVWQALCTIGKGRNEPAPPSFVRICHERIDSPHSHHGVKNPGKPLHALLPVKHRDTCNSIQHALHGRPAEASNHTRQRKPLCKAYHSIDLVSGLFSGCHSISLLCRSPLGCRNPRLVELPKDHCLGHPLGFPNLNHHRNRL